MGEQNLKNIARPVRVYRVRPDLVAEVQAATGPHLSMPRRMGPAILTIMTVLILVIAGLGWRFWPSTTSSPTSPTVGTSAQTKPPVSEPFVAPRLSIVVLPFNNLSNDPEQQYFVDGVTEDLTTDLSRISHMLVISRNSAFTYKDKPIIAKQIGRELGVRYLLEGSVQRSENRVRVNAQLVDAASDTHLWAERFDQDLGDLFAMQNEITHRIAIALSAQLISAEAGRPTEHPDALDYIFRGRAAMNKGLTPDAFGRAIDFFEHALALDPQSIEAQLSLANMLAGRVLAGMSKTRTADIARAEDLVSKSFAAPSSAGAHFIKGQLLRAKGRCDQAIPEFEAAIASDRNFSSAFFSLGVCKLLTGSIDETIPLEERSIRLDPRDPAVFNRFVTIGEVHLLQSRTDEAIVQLEKARSLNPVSPWPHVWLAAAYGLKDQTDRAAAELSTARTLLGGGTFSSIAAMKAVVGAPVLRPLYEATFLAGLRKAGMPEDSDKR